MKLEWSLKAIFIEYFAFLTKDTQLYLSTHFKKKSQKTPKAEIELAKKLKKQYFVDKKLNAENEKGNRKNIKK